MEQEVEKAYNKYLSVLELWCFIRMPSKATEAYKLLRGRVLRYGREKIRREEYASAVETIERKRLALEKAINIQADEYLFFNLED